METRGERQAAQSLGSDGALLRSLGGHVEGCDDCGHLRIAYNSCRNRQCPRCQGAAARDWLAERASRRPKLFR